MKISQFSFVLMFVALFVVVEVSYAQMINYNRRNRRSGNAVQAQQSVSVTPKAQAPAVRTNSYYQEPVQEVKVEPVVESASKAVSVAESIQAALAEQEVVADNIESNLPTEVAVEMPSEVPAVMGDPQVSNRVERLYDLNRDGILQKDEVADFYRDVVSSVRNKGKFKVSSDLLKTFDVNNDGEIGRYEVSGLVNQLN